MHNPFSFYVVFNPLLNGNNENYQTQAHEFFQRLKENLLSGMPENGHFYWGKIKVNNDEKALQFDNYKAAVEANQNAGLPTHLYISDFHHFWVCKVESVHKEIFDKTNTLPFYDGKEVEIWFKVTDMDLISSEYVETGYYLEQLYVDNQFDPHNVDSINPYISGLRYPLIVQNKLNEFYFMDYHKLGKARALSNNPLIQNPSEFGKIAHTVQAYVLPPAIYGKLSEQIKKRLIKIELDISSREKENHDIFYRVKKEYIKLLEGMLNETFVKFLKYEAPEKIGFELQGDEQFFTRDLSHQKIKEAKYSFSLQEICKIINDPVFVQSANLDMIFSDKLKFWKYLRSELMEIVQTHDLLNEPSENPGAKEAMLLRNIVLGVGCKGIINSLICLYYEEDFMDSYFKNVA